MKIHQTQKYPNKPTIVFLHDSLGCIKLWRDFPEKIGALTELNILVYDRQGYGESEPFTKVKRDPDYLEIEADILNQLLKEQNIKQAILYGHSDGGTIALIAAAKYPGRIAAVITEGAHIFVEDISVEGLKKAVLEYQTTNLKDKLAKYHGDKTEAMFNAWTETWLSERFRPWNIEHLLPQIICPVLVIQGENDEYGTIAQVEGIINQVKGKAEKYIVPDAKHTPHKEKQNELTQKVAEYIKKIISQK